MPDANGDFKQFLRAFTSEDEKTNIILASEISRAPEDLRQAVLALPPVEKIELDSDYLYRIKDNAIKTASDRNPVSLLHEYGHFVDFNLPDEQAKTLRLINFETILKDSSDKVIKNKSALIADLDTLPVSSDKCRLLDFFGAVTKNEVGYGHDTDFFEFDGNQGCEAFANMVAIYARNKEEWKLLQKYTGDLAGTFRQILSKITPKSK